MDYIPTAYPTDINQKVWENIGKGTLVLGGVMGGLWFIGIIFGILTYIYLSICLMIIAKKTNTKNSWMAWIPILDLVLMVNLAKKPTWVFLLFLVPVVNIITVVFLWMEIAKNRNKPEWIGIATIIPIVGYFALGYLAFSK